MSQIFQHLHTLKINHLHFVESFVAFFENYQWETKNSLLLAYLIVPLLTQELSRDALESSNKTSRMKNLKERMWTSLYGLERKVNNYIELTNSIIQYGIENGFFLIDNDCSIKVLEYRENSFPVQTEKTLLKASKNLATVFSKTSIRDTFILLGIKHLWKHI